MLLLFNTSHAMWNNIFVSVQSYVPRGNNWTLPCNSRIEASQTKGSQWNPWNFISSVNHCAEGTILPFGPKHHRIIPHITLALILHLIQNFAIPSSPDTIHPMCILSPNISNHSETLCKTEKEMKYQLWWNNFPVPIVTGTCLAGADFHSLCLRTFAVSERFVRSDPFVGPSTYSVIRTTERIFNIHLNKSLWSMIEKYTINVQVNTSYEPKMEKYI